MRNQDLLLLAVLSLTGCSRRGLELPVPHFDPPTATTLSALNTPIKLINLDDQSKICFSTDGTVPDLSSGACAHEVGADRTLAVPSCGFNVVRIAWPGGRDEASYVVEDPACQTSCEPVLPWANEDMLRAFRAWRDDVTCLLNGCQRPSGTGNWSADCDSGGVDWDVSLNGFRALSTFTFKSCARTVAIEVGAGDQKEMKKVTLVGTGSLVQDVDFGADGHEGGSVRIEGDFVGSVTSRIVLNDGNFSAGAYYIACSAQPLPGKVCAPAQAKIGFDYPDWRCQGDICPQAKVGTCALEPDADADGVPDAVDTCPELPGTDQLDSDHDGVGDACEPKPKTLQIRTKLDNRCLVAAEGQTVTAGSCAPNDLAQTWELTAVDDAVGFRHVASGQCLTQAPLFLGLASIVTAPCNDSPQQRWRLERYEQGGFDSAFPHRLRSLADDLCLQADVFGSVSGALFNCDQLGTEQNRKLGLYYGDSPSAAPSPL